MVDGLTDATYRLYNSIVENLPDDMTLKESHKSQIRQCLKKIGDESAAKALDLIAVQLPVHRKIALNVWDAIDDSEHPDLLVSRFADNFDYAYGLGWQYSSSMLFMIRDSFKHIGAKGQYTPEQQRALIRVEDSKWLKNMTPESGGSSWVYSYALCVNKAAILHPDKVEQIVEIAQTRNPHSLDYILAMLDSNASLPLTAGSL